MPVPDYRALIRPLAVDIAGMLSLDDATEARVRGFWAAALNDNPFLFDGPVLTVTGIAEDRLTVHEASYRHVKAARTDAAMAERLGLRLLAVSGVLRCADGLVFGLRGDCVTEDRGLWELVPSGGAVTTDLAGQLLEELRDEIGLGAEQVTLGAPCGMVLGAGVIDIVFPIATSLSGEAVAQIHGARGSAEYGEVLVVPDSGAFKFTGGVLSETSRVILDHWPK